MILRSLHPIFAAELIGADLGVPPAQDLVDTVERAMDEHGVLVIRDCRITDAQQIRFSRAFGPLELPSRGGGKFNAPREMAPELFYVGNLDPEGNIIPINRRS